MLGSYGSTDHDEIVDSVPFKLGSVKSYITDDEWINRINELSQSKLADCRSNKQCSDKICGEDVEWFNDYLQRKLAETLIETIDERYSRTIEVEMNELLSEHKAWWTI